MKTPVVVTTKRRFLCKDFLTLLVPLGQESRINFTSKNFPTPLKTIKRVWLEIHFKLVSAGVHSALK